MDVALSLSPYLIVADARAAITFYAAAFGAIAGEPLIDPADGKVGHVELTLAGATVMLADEYPDFGALAPTSLGGTPVRLHLAVDDADAAFARALAAGAIEQRPVKDQFYGSRAGTLVDPFGHIWIVSADAGAVSTQESQARWDAMHAS